MLCEAHDLKRILNAIADHIADADKRHSEALGAMQQRLAELGSQAKGMRTELPAEMIPSLDRIETGMAELSGKFAEAETPHRHGAELALVPHEVDDAPAALRSMFANDPLGSGSFTRRDEVARAAVKPSVDTFDVVSFDDPAHEEEPWDAASAEALTRLYEINALDMVGHGHDEPAARQHEIEAVEAAVEARAEAPVPAPAPASSALPAALAVTPAVVEQPVSDERRWLEQRFTDIAVKLDQSLTGLRPDGGFGELASQFARLEQRLTSVMAETPSRTDLQSLKAIETQVEDLTLQLDTVQTHFARLDAIELELRSVSERITEENIGRMLERSAPRGAAEQMPRIESALQQIAERLSEDRAAKLAAEPHAAPLDPDAMARRVAAMLADQMQAPAAAPVSAADAQRIDELRTLLTGFITEQRHGDEQTTTMLDTMQQAMIRLLDRMDALETGTEGHAPGLDAELNRPTPLAQPLYADDRLAAPEFSSAIGRRDPVPAVDRVDERRAKPQSAAADHSLPAEPRKPTAPIEPTFATAKPLEAKPVEIKSELDHDAPGRDRAAGETDGATETTPGVINRDDFVAAARRAARQVAQAPREMPDDALEIDVAPAAAKPSPRRAPAKVAARGGSRSPSMLTVSLVCMIVAGASFMIAKPFIMSSFNTANQPRVIPTSKLPVGDAKPADADDGDEVIEKAPDSSGDRGPAMPKRSSFTAPSPGGEAPATPGMFDIGNRGAISVGSLVDADGNLISTRESAGPGGFGAAARQPELGRAMPVVPAALSPAAAADANAGTGSDVPPAMIGPNSLRQAAVKGDPSAEFEIGARFAEGKGVPQDLKQAVTWYQRSAAKGFAPAQYRLASMFERGLGVKSDLPRASVWYQRAAEQGIVKAMHNLAVLNAGREGTPADYPVALRWFTAASEHGLTDSQFNLAIMHETGLGLEKDLREAYKWFSLAARAGDAEASKRRDAVRAKLTPAEQRDADAQIEAWRGKVADNSINDPRVAGEAWKSRAR